MYVTRSMISFPQPTSNMQGSIMQSGHCISIDALHYKYLHTYVYIYILSGPGDL